MNVENSWTISELQRRLEAMKAKHGDAEVWIDDADTQWHLPLTDEMPWGKPIRFDPDRGRVLLASSYTV